MSEFQRMDAQQRETPINVNLGCGARWKADWANVDGGLPARLAWLRRMPLLGRLLPQSLRRYPPNLIYLDLRQGKLPFPDSSVSAIFSGYALEYLTVAESRRVLKECCRVLRPGGVLRLCQTDIGSIVERYRQRVPEAPSEEAVENAAEFLAHAAPEHSKFWVRLVRRGGVQQLFDRASLEYSLAISGFADVRFYPAGEGECPDLEWIERPERSAAPLLHVEAKKAMPAVSSRRPASRKGAAACS
jgi:SAM-dependent methyltransferase